MFRKNLDHGLHSFVNVIVHRELSIGSNGMQFISNGPDIPDELLQAHEEGRVVFFCGAGISYPAGLPGFSGLVDQIFRLSGTKPEDIEQQAINRGQFDATLDLLERRLPGQRLAVRSALAKALKPNLRRKGATMSQAALLHLARSREGSLRLVTTNFDRIFHAAAKQIGQSFIEYAAPMLPIPKKSRWNGLVFLHGLLPKKTDDTSLNRLVVTSGDFGLAYLTERWAARFVSELFRNYVVCFVGYSINDPVLRYMMDALAADRMLGEVTQQAWALGDCVPGQEDTKTNEWKSKGVTPILYSVPAGSGDHSALHMTLHAWAETYRDGVQGKEAIVIKHALARPQDSTKQDDFVGRLLWALSDKSGLPAKRFAEFNPTPSLDWLLDAFALEQYKHADLNRFGVPPHDEIDSKLHFSLVRRPAPYDRAAPMLLATSGLTSSTWDDVMFHLARWLLRHLNDPRLIIWIADRGGNVDNRWRLLIEDELDKFTSLEDAGGTAVLEEILFHAPKSIPCHAMRTLWRLLLTGQVKSSTYDPDLFRWKGRLKQEGLTTSLRLELRKLLAPKVVLKKALRLSEVSNINEEPVRINQLVDWKLTLAADHANFDLCGWADERWKSSLPLLLQDFQQLVRDALDLLCELGGADANNSDRSYWDLPSITPHWQNRGFQNWVTLIELLRNAWLAVRDTDSAEATRIAHSWFELPYPTFKRLGLFAASLDGCIPPDKWVDWLLTDGGQWLWSISTRREVYRLLVLQAQHMAAADQVRLEATILAGPPHGMYRDDLDQDRLQDLMAHAVWLHLAKLNASGLTLGGDALTRFKEISLLYPKWEMATNESDEFPRWMSGTGDPDYEDSRKVNIAPRKRNDLVTWLRNETPNKQELDEDTWRDVCSTRFFHALLALRDLALKDEWPPDRWSQALQAWSDDGSVLRSWRYAAPLVLKMPNSVLQEIANGATWWMEAVSKSINYNENILIEMCCRVLSLPQEAFSGSNALLDDDTYDPVSFAINHPIGHVTQALINLWFKKNPNDNELLPIELKTIFTSLCDIQKVHFRHGRVLLGSRIIAFYRVDRPWTEQYLLPFFSWNNRAEAKALWEGFLWSPRLYQPLLFSLKAEFLKCAIHYKCLGNLRHQYSAFLTYVALSSPDGFTNDEFQMAIGTLPNDGLEECAQALSQALEGAANQREDYWSNRVLPFWQNIWPKTRDKATTRVAESLAKLVIAARRQFPAALAVVYDWLKPIEHPHHVLHLLAESGLCNQFPEDSLLLLSAVIPDQQWPVRRLRQCLNDIVQAEPLIAQDARYKRLNQYCRKWGM